MKSKDLRFNTKDDSENNKISEGCEIINKNNGIKDGIKYGSSCYPNYKSSFSFREQSCIEAPIDEKITVKIKRISFSVATLYFVEDGKRTIIPNEIKVIDETNKGIAVEPLPNTQSFALCWTDNYSIKKNDKYILQLKSERLWDISGWHNKN